MPSLLGKMLFSMIIGGVLITLAWGLGGGDEGLMSVAGLVLGLLPQGLESRKHFPSKTHGSTPITPSKASDRLY